MCQSETGLAGIITTTETATYKLEYIVGWPTETAVVEISNRSVGKKFRE